MAGLSEEEILKHFTLLCLEEVERGSPDVKICEAYMRRRCRERWARMDSQERDAIFEMVAEVADGQLQQQDHNANETFDSRRKNTINQDNRESINIDDGKNMINMDNRGKVEAQCDDGDEWQPKPKKRRLSKAGRRPSAFNIFAAEVRRRGQKLNSRLGTNIFFMSCSNFRDLSCMWSKLSKEEKEGYRQKEH